MYLQKLDKHFCHQAPDVNYNEHKDFSFQTRERGSGEEGIQMFFLKKNGIKCLMLNSTLYA